MKINGTSYNESVKNVSIESIKTVLSGLNTNAERQDNQS